MRAVVQRVLHAKVEVNGSSIGAIDRGLLVYVGIAVGDDEHEAQWLADKVANLRVFEDSAGKMSCDLREISGGLLVISQFTVVGDVRRGRRPSFDRAMAPEQAELFYNAFVHRLRATNLPVETGKFRADMKVLSLNDGPITLVIDSPREETTRFPGVSNIISERGSILNTGIKH